MSQPMKDKLLIADVDGTLINSGFQVPLRNLEAIEQFQRDGGLFTLATGRAIESARQYAEQIGLSCPAIVSNGSMLFDYKTDQVVWERLLPLQAKHYIFEVLEHFPKIGVEVHSGRHLYVIRMSEMGKKHVTDENLTFEEVELEQIWDLPWSKVLYAATPEELAPVREYTESMPHEGAYYADTAPIYYELHPMGTSKGDGMRRLAFNHKISLKNTAAIGNFYNDADMVEHAGAGAFVAEAPNDLKAKADYVSCSFEEGAVADFIEYLYRFWAEQ